MANICSPVRAVIFSFPFLSRLTFFLFTQQTHSCLRPCTAKNVPHHPISHIVGSNIYGLKKCYLVYRTPQLHVERLITVQLHTCPEAVQSVSQLPSCTSSHSVSIALTGSPSHTGRCHPLIRLTRDVTDHPIWKDLEAEQSDVTGLSGQVQ